MARTQLMAVVAVACVTGALAKYMPSGVGKDMLSYNHGPGMWSSGEGCCREEVAVLNPNPYYNWPQEGHMSTRISRHDAETVWIGISGEYLREDQMRLKKKFGSSTTITPYEMCKSLCEQEMGKTSSIVDVNNPFILPMNDAFGNRIPSERTCSAFELTKIKKAWTKKFSCGKERANKWCVWLGNAEKTFTMYDGGYKCELHMSPVNTARVDSRACKRSTCATAEVASGHMYVPPFADEAFQVPFAGEDALNRVDDPNAFKGSLVIVVPSGFPECQPTIEPGYVYSAGPGNLSTHDEAYAVEGSYSVENLSPYLRRITRNDDSNLTSWNESFVVVCKAHTSCGNQLDGATRLTGESATAPGTCAACSSGASAASDTDDCACSGLAPNDAQCDSCAPALVDHTTYIEHKKKEVPGNDLELTIPAEMDGACGVTNSTMYKSAIDLEWLELRHPVLGDALPTYDKNDYPNGGRENMTNMKDLAAAACSSNPDCLGFNWYKEKYVVFKSSAAVQEGDCAGKWSGCHKKEIRFYEKPPPIFDCHCDLTGGRGCSTALNGKVIPATTDWPYSDTSTYRCVLNCCDDYEVMGVSQCC